jgi:large repetitive protein
LSGSTGISPGGADNEAGAIAVDTNGNFYVTGITSATNFPVTPGVFRATNSGGFNDAFIAKFSSPPDLSVTMVASPNPVTVGSNVTYTLRLNNNGVSTFSGVTNVVQFPTNVRFGTITTTLGGFSTNATGRLTFNIGTLTNNASVTQTVVITNQSSGTFTNIASLTGIETGSLEPNKSNNVAAVVALVRGISDVTLAQSASPNPAFVGSNLTYTVGITNKGPSPATSIVLSNTLSPLVSFVSATNTFGTCSNVDGVLVCDFGTLANGAGARVTITTLAIAGGTATNLASVSAFESDFNPANNASSLLTTVNGSADLQLGMTASTNSVYAGNNLTYTLGVTNDGPSAAAAVVLNNPLPPGATLVSATTTVGTTN